MAHVNDLKFAALVEAGFTSGTLNDREYAWLADLNSVSSGLTLNDQWMTYLDGEGFTSGTLNDRQMAFWQEWGYTGTTWNDLAMQFWADGGPIMPQRTTTLTAAQLADLHNTPVELVPAPGAGKVALPTSAYYFLNLNGAAWDEGEAKAVLMYGDYGGGEVDIFTDPDGNSVPGLTQGYSSPSGGAGIGSFGSIPSIVEGGWWDGAAGLEYVEDTAVNLVCDDVSDPFIIPGAIATFSIGAAGTGYIVGDEIYSEDAVLTVATVGGGGEITSLTLTTPGSTNILGDGQSTTTDSALGADFTLDIDSLDYSVNPMELKVKVIYSIFNLA